MTDTALATKNSLHITKADKGDLTFEWDPADETEVNQARLAFANAKAQGYFAYSVETVDGEPSNTLIKEFDPNATKVVMTPQLVGG